MIKSFIERIAREVFWEEARTYDRTVVEIARRAIVEHRADIGDVPVQLDEGAKMPLRAHDTDAGADIFCKEDFVVPAHDSVEIGTGVHIQLPPNTKAELVSKSGLNVKHCIQTSGLIDEGYGGEIRVRVYNHGSYDYEFKAGDKITQMVITTVCYPGFVPVDKVESGSRGSAGFGSSGR